MKWKYTKHFVRSYIKRYVQMVVPGMYVIIYLGLIYDCNSVAITYNATYRFEKVAWHFTRFRPMVIPRPKLRT